MQMVSDQPWNHTIPSMNKVEEKFDSSTSDEQPMSEDEMSEELTQQVTLEDLWKASTGVPCQVSKNLCL